MYNFVTCNQIESMLMSKLRRFILLSVACLALSAWAQAPDEENDNTPEWYLDEVVNDMFVGHYDFEYYYMPSASEMSQQRGKGEVSYFLNTPTGLNRKKTCDLVDRIMASYDDVKAVSDWHMTTTIYWKEFRIDRNKFRFNVKRKALDDGTYYVSVTETANHYKSLGKSKKNQGKAQSEPSGDKPAKRSTRQGRRPVVDNDDAQPAAQDTAIDLDDVGASVPVVSEKQRRREAREQKAAEEQAERARKRRAQEKRREEIRAQKEAEKQKKAEEKRKKEEEKRLKKEEEKRQREEARREREAARQQAAAPKPVESRYHYTDVALWLSEKYDFTQTAGGDASCTMYSTAVKDVEMAKLAIKNALKGSNARMAVPWRVNSDNQAIETGYTVDGHVLVFAIGTDDASRITLTITEVSGEEFEAFKQGL